MSNFSLGISGSIYGDGIKEQTNWDASASSSRFKNKELLDFSGASSFLDDYTFYGNLGESKKINFGPSEVKILDNIAAVSYPKFTDLSKVVHTIKPSGEDYIPLISLLPSSGRVFDPGVVILPIFDFNFIEEFLLHISPSPENSSANKIPRIDLDGLYISITYDGEVSAAPGAWKSIPGLSGSRQILKWCPPGFYLDGYSSVDPDGHIPPGYFSVRQIEKLSELGCSTSCSLEKMYVIVANIGFDNQNINSSYELSCNPTISNIATPSIPPQAPDIFDNFDSYGLMQEEQSGQQLFGSFDWAQYVEPQGQSYGDAICYNCNADCSLQILLPGETCAQYGFFTNQEECFFVKENHDCKRGKCKCCVGAQEGGVDFPRTNDSSYCSIYSDAIWVGDRYTGGYHCNSVCPDEISTDSCACGKDPIYTDLPDGTVLNEGKPCSKIKCPCCINGECNEYPLDCVDPFVGCAGSAENNYAGEPCIPCTNPDVTLPPCEFGLLCYTCIEGAGCIQIYTQEDCESCSACGYYDSVQQCQAYCTEPEKPTCYECVQDANKCFEFPLQGTNFSTCSEAGLFSNIQDCETLCSNPPPRPTIDCTCCVNGICQETQYPDIGLPCEALCDTCLPQNIGYSCFSGKRCDCCVDLGGRSSCLSFPYPEGTRCEDVCDTCDSVGYSCDTQDPKNVICECCIDGTCSEVEYPPGTDCMLVCIPCDIAVNNCSTEFKYCDCCIDGQCIPIQVSIDTDCSSVCAGCDSPYSSCSIEEDFVSCDCCIGEGVSARCVSTLYPKGTICSEVCNTCEPGSICYNGDGQDQDICIKASIFSSEIKCSEITLIKYKPIIECGKVDLYTRVSGQITSYAQGIYTSNNHGLLYKDEIKIYGSLKTKSLNGIFYVGEIVDENSFKLYKEESLQTPITLNVSENINWIKTDTRSSLDRKYFCGQVDYSVDNALYANGHGWDIDELVNYQIKIISGTGAGQIRTVISNYHNNITVSKDWAVLPDSTSTFSIESSYYSRWKYHSTIFSPRGQNGYSEADTIAGFQSRRYFWSRETTLLPLFDNKSNFDEIFISDYLSKISDKKYQLSNDFYAWNHIRDLRPQTSTEKAASVLDLFCLFPISQEAVLPKNKIVSGRPTNIHDQYLNSIDFKNSGKIKSLESSEYGVGDIWNSAFNIVNGFEFGSSIDMAKDASGKYYLLVGEPGAKTIVDTGLGFYKYPQKYLGEPYQYINPWYNKAPVLIKNTNYQLPKYANGSAFLFEITLSGGSLQNVQPPYLNSQYYSPITLSDFYNAHRNDQDISSPSYLSTKYDDGLDLVDPRKYIFNVNFFSKKNLLPITINYTGSKPVESSTLYTRLRTLISNSMSSCIGNVYLYNSQPILDEALQYSLIEEADGFDYWYGGMIYGCGETSGYGKTVESNLSRLYYFSDLGVPVIEKTSDKYANQKYSVGFFRRNDNLYPYIDSFGKSVSLHFNNQEMWVFCSSKVKPYVYRPLANNYEEVLDDKAKEANCGYLHVFKDGQKIQKIESDSCKTLSNKWISSIHFAENFAKCIKIDSGKVYVGQSKPIEIASSFGSWDYKKSKIHEYLISSNSLDKINSIENANDRFLYYQIAQDLLVPDLKTSYLSNELDKFVYLENESVYFYPSDRFGDNFRVRNGVMVANAYDDRNELGDVHTQIRSPYNSANQPLVENDYWTEFNRVQDYLHVYKNLNNAWVFCQKISPAFKYDEDKFRFFENDYSDKVANSIRSIGGISYSNTSDKSITWDIDLCGKFDLVDGRILLKDPVSFSIFSEDLSIARNNELLKDVSYKTLYLDPYFTYSEKFNSEKLIEEGSCNIEFDRLNSIYSYDKEVKDKADVIYRTSQELDGDLSKSVVIPIYFINIPKGNFEHYSIQQIKFILDEIPSNISNPNIKMVLYKKDPRKTIYPYYAHEYTTCLPAVSSTRIRSRKDSDTFIPYRGGACDLEQYSIESFLNDSPEYFYSDGKKFQEFSIAKTITPTTSISEINGRKVNEYTITFTDLDFYLGDFIIKDNLISNWSRSFGSESISSNDIQSIGFDSSVQVQDSLIVGFIFDSADYGFDFSSRNYQSEISINQITATVKYSASNKGQYSRSMRNYSCVSTDVLPIRGYDRLLNFYENKNVNYAPNGLIDEIPVLKSQKSVMGSSYPSVSVASNENSNSTMDGANSPSYSLISIDEYKDISARSFDIHKLEYLSMFIEGSIFIQSFNGSPLITSGPLSHHEQSTLFMDGTGIMNGSTSLYVSAPVPNNSISSLYTKSSFVDSVAGVLFTKNQNEDNSSLTITTKAMSPRMMSLFVKAPVLSVGVSPMFINSFYSENIVSLFVEACDNSVATTPFFIKTDISLNGTSLYSSGPVVQENGSDLFLKTYETYNNGMRLRIPKVFGSDNLGAPLFISTTELNSVPLTIFAPSPYSVEDDFSAFIYGSQQSVLILSNTLPVFLLGKSSLFKDSENGSVLFIASPGLDNTVSFAPLCIKNIWDKTSVAESLIIGGSYSASGVNFNQVRQESSSLFIKNQQTDFADCSLFVYQKEGGDFTSLFMKSSGQNKDMNMYVTANYGEHGSSTLVISNSIGNSLEDLTIFLNGFRR